MGLLDATWHLLNFLAPAVGLGSLSAGLVKFAWRHELRSVGWLRLALWTSSAAMSALIASLIVLGRDGTMTSYAAMVLASVLALWWTGFRRPGR
jgi:hypothetical protein